MSGQNRNKQYDDLYRQSTVQFTNKNKTNNNNKIYLKHGQGIERYSPDKYYEGQFWNDMKHGEGEEMYDINTTFKGTFEKNKKIKGEIFWADTFSKYDG